MTARLHLVAPAAVLALALAAPVAFADDMMNKDTMSKSTDSKMKSNDGMSKSSDKMSSDKGMMKHDMKDKKDNMSGSK
jgi:pentapeptide MXKDX repeat protein